MGVIVLALRDGSICHPLQPLCSEERRLEEEGGRGGVEGRGAIEAGVNP